jgi:nucleoside-diphosphate-sugar epimerase
VQRGDVDDLEGLRQAAGSSDGVIHTAFNHDFSKFAAACAQDKLAIETLGSALAGSNRPLVVTSGTGLLAPGRVASEEDVHVATSDAYPRVSEDTALALAGKGVHASVIRLPQVHDRFKFGLVSYMIQIARQKGASMYCGDGLNRWPAVHRLDAGHLYRLVLEKGSAGGKYHAVAEEGVPVRTIAESIGRGLKIPVVSITAQQAAEQLGFIGFFMGLDCPASSALTQKWLGWHPTPQPGMIEDLDHAHEFEA